MSKLRALGALAAALVCAPFLGIALLFLTIVTLAWVYLQRWLGKKKEWDCTDWWNPRRRVGHESVEQHHQDSLKTSQERGWFYRRHPLDAE